MDDFGTDLDGVKRRQVEAAKPPPDRDSYGPRRPHQSRTPTLGGAGRRFNSSSGDAFGPPFTGLPASPTIRPAGLLHQATEA